MPEHSVSALPNKCVLLVEHNPEEVQLVLARKKRILFSMVLVAIPIVTVSGIVLLFEFYLRFQDPPAPNNIRTEAHNGVEAIEWYPVLGAQLRQGGQYRHTHHFGTDGTFDTVVTLEKDRFRHTPVSSPETRDRFLALFGCSMMFGTSVNDDETVPYFMGKHFPAWMPYNFGVPGMSTPHMLARIQQEGGLRTNIPQSEGKAVCLYFDYEIERIVGAQALIKSWDVVRPAYGVDHGELKYLGSLREAYPWRMWFYDATWHNSAIVRQYLNFPLGGRYSYYDASVVAATVIESAKQFKMQYPDSEFVFAAYIWPERAARYRVREIMRMVADAGIRTIDIYKESGGLVGWTHYTDGHFKPTTCEKLALLLGRELGL
jgi:hypothetical protein